MKIHIKKINTLPEALFPDAFLPPDYETTKDVNKETFSEPRVGQQFRALDVNTGRAFQSSIITEIIDDHTFRTLNSVYEWEIIK